MISGFIIERTDTGITVSRYGPTGQKIHLPLSIYREGGWGAVFIGYRYYGPTRCDTLRGDNSAVIEDFSKETVAAEVVVRYRQNGLSALAEIEGDFVSVIWDETRGVLIGLRDPMGGFPLFWVQRGTSFTFSTSLRWLHDQNTAAPDLDPEYIAEYLTAPTPAGEVAGRCTIYKGIQRVPPGTAVIADGVNHTVRQERFWHWTDHMESHSSTDLNELGRTLRRRLKAAVETRMKGRACCHLSGGLDSTMVSLLALQTDLSRNEDIHAISLIYRKRKNLARETPFIKTVLAENPRLRHHLIPADDCLDFNSYTDAPIHDEPYPQLGRLALDRAAIEPLRPFGIETLLTGIGADELFDTAPYHIKDLISRLKLLKAWRQAAFWAHRRHANAWQMVARYGLDLMGPAVSPWKRLAGDARGSLRASLSEMVPPWIRSTFSRRYRLHERAYEHHRRVYEHCHPTALSVGLHGLRSRAGDFNRWHIALPAGIHISHPFLDPRVAGFGLGVLSEMQITPQQSKPLLRIAGRDLLPDKILSRPDKGDFNEIYYAGLARNLPVLEQLALKAPAVDGGIFHRQRLIHYLQQAALGAVGTALCRQLNMSLCFLQWSVLRTAPSDLVKAPITRPNAV